MFTASAFRLYTYDGAAQGQSQKLGGKVIVDS